MNKKRRSKEQLKKLREIFGDISKHSEFLEQEAIREEACKGLNIITSMEEDNKDLRKCDER